MVVCGSVATAAERSGFDLSGVGVAQAISLYYREVAHVPHIICDSVLNDSRVVSIRADGKVLDDAMFRSLLEQYGFEARKDKSGLVRVCKAIDASTQTELESLVYRPKNRDVAYLVDLSAPLVKGTFANRRASAVSTTVVPPVAGASAVAGQAPQQSGYLPAQMPAPSMGTASDDMLVFFGEAKECEKLRRLLEQLDQKPLQVLVKAYLYDVGKTSNEASALNILLTALKGRIGVSVGSQVKNGNVVSVSIGGLDAIASALSGDGRFKVVASPSTLLRSGASARLQVGSDQQVQSSQVTTNGTTTTGYDFKSAGVILDVSAKVHDDQTDIDLTQTVSDFVPSTAGNAAVTINTRQLRTALTVGDGDLIVIGGLQQQRNSSSRNKLPFFDWTIGTQADVTEDELVLVLEVKKV